MFLKGIGRESFHNTGYQNEIWIPNTKSKKNGSGSLLAKKKRAKRRRGNRPRFDGDFKWILESNFRKKG